MEKKPTTVFGQTIRRERKRMGLTQAALAKKIGFTRAYVSLVELSDATLRQAPQTLNLLAKILQLNVSRIKEIQNPRKLKQICGCGGLGKFLTEKRLKRNLSRKELAELAGVKPSRILYLEQGWSNTNKALVDLKKLEKALGYLTPLELIPPRLRPVWSRLS